ncbi:MAG: hypothetical protein ABEK59_07530 [Halobacteria archaeon]
MEKIEIDPKGSARVIFSETKPTGLYRALNCTKVYKTKNGVVEIGIEDLKQENLDRLREVCDISQKTINDLKDLRDNLLA